MAIAKATILEDVHQTFYTLLNAITGFTGNLYPAYPDLNLDAASSKSSYPIFVLNSPEIETWESHTLTKVKLTGTIRVDIFTTSAKTCDQYASDVIDKIETSINSLRTNGLRFIELTDTSKDQYERGKIMVHNKGLTFQFEFIFSRSSLPW
jgi:hypothetical protein